MQTASSTQKTSSDATLRRDWQRLTALTFLFAFGFAVYNGVFQNFLKDVLNSKPQHLGTLESLREVPGLLTALMAGTLVAMAETRIAALGLFIAGLGIGATGAITNYPMLVAVSLFWSVGFHLWAGMSSPITLTLAKGQEGGRHLGRMNGISSTATFIGLGTALALSWTLPRMGVSLPDVYRFDFFLGGGCILLAAVFCARLSTHAVGGPRARLILRKEYGLYYLLTFLEGCRRQIFAIFATFTLILHYKVPVESMLALQFINAILISLTAPNIGKIVDRRGERGPLVFYSVGLIFVFMGYSLVQNVWVLVVLYLLDNVLFSFGVGFTTYLNRIVRPGELTPCISMGVTMNHIAAVTVPISGAWLWEHFHYQVPFRVGVFIAIISLVATYLLPRGIAQRRVPNVSLTETS
jgi:MFS family permease